MDGWLRDVPRPSQQAFKAWPRPRLPFERAVESPLLQGRGHKNQGDGMSVIEQATPAHTTKPPDRPCHLRSRKLGNRILCGATDFVPRPQHTVADCQTLGHVICPLCLLEREGL